MPIVLRFKSCLLAVLVTILVSACGSSNQDGDSGNGTPLPPPPGLGSTSYDPCNAGDFSWQGPYAAEAISLPALTLLASTPGYNPASVPATFSGTVLRPADTDTYPGQRPAIVIEHGEAGDQCNLWWLAHALAGAGYVTLVFTQTDQNPLTSPGSSIAAMYSALAFIESSSNPFAVYTDTSRIGLVGHSEGASSASYVQGIAPLSTVRTIVALDNLKHYLSGDPGSALAECLGAAKEPVTPIVPALGFAEDQACASEPTVTTPNIKESGWSWWMQSAQPSVELVMSGYNHLSFISLIAGGGSSQQLQTLSIYIQAWFDRWLGNDTSADQRLQACSINGQSFVGLLSTNYLSGIYLPSANAQSSDFRSLLAGRCPS